MRKYKIIHTGEDIHWVDGPVLSGMSVTYVNVSECGNVVAQPAWYKLVNRQVVLRDNWQDIRDAEIAAKLAKDERISGFIAARQASVMRELTVEQATAYISGQMDTTDLDALAPVIEGIANLADAKALLLNLAVELRKMHKKTEDILTKMVPYLLD